LVGTRGSSPLWGISKAYDCIGLTMSRWRSPSQRIIVSRSRSLELRALAQAPFILFAPGLCFSHEVIADCRLNGFDPVIGQVVPQISSAVNLASAELSVSIVPASITPIQVVNSPHSFTIVSATSSVSGKAQRLAVT
jgi:DNA-binding transcriptional LysR family regulator